jgi:surface protein
MFLDCKKLISLDVSKWNTQNVTTMNSTFNGTTNLPELDISNWNVKNVKSFSGMFKGCGVTQFDFSKWETPSLTNIKMMFYGSHA